MLIPRRDRHLNEALETLNERFINAGGDTLAAFESLLPYEIEFVDEEIERCMTDFRYYIENYHCIITKGEGVKMLYPLKESQERFLEALTNAEKISNTVRFLILKARQIGISTLSAARIFHWTIFAEARNTLVVAQTIEQADYLFEMSRFAHDNLPWWMRPEVRYDSKGRYLVFDRKDAAQRIANPGLRSGITVAAANQPGGVAIGKGLSISHGSELALWKDGKVLAEQLLPALEGAGSKGLWESTARGRGNFFHRLWKAAEDGDIPWTPLFIPAYTIKTYFLPILLGENFRLNDEEVAAKESVLAEMGDIVPDEHFKWRRAKEKESATLTTEESLDQEYPLCITGETLVSTEMGILPVKECANANFSESGKIKRWITQKPSEIWELKTKQGRILRGTHDHPVMTDAGWCFMSRLSTGQTIHLRGPRFAESNFVAESTNPKCLRHSIEITPDLGRLIGYFIGDGCWYKTQFYIACDAKDGDVVADVVRLTNEYLETPSLKNISKVKGRKGCTYVLCQGRAMGGYSSIRQALYLLGLIRQYELSIGTWTKHLRVPPCIFRSPRNVVREFLRGLFEADGSSSPKTGQVRFYTKSHGFAREIQLLLLGFGINVRLNPVTRKAGNSKNYTGVEIPLTLEASELFHSEIGFVGRRKSGNTTKQKKPGVGRERAPNLMSDTVESVERRGFENTFDFTVEGEAFSANGILTHNTPESAFQATGVTAFNKKRLMEALRLTVRRPIMYGEIDLVYSEVLRLHEKRASLRIVKVEDHKKPIPPQKEYGSRLYVWEEPERGRDYYIGGDPSLGIPGGAFSCAQVFKIGRGGEKDIQVAEWHGWMDTEPFARVLAALGYWYNEAQVAIEMNNECGGACHTYFTRALEYPNWFQWERYDRAVVAKTNYIGWVTNNKTRGYLLSKYRQGINESTIVMRSKALVDQCLSFSRADGETRWEDQEGSGDRVLAAMICIWCAHASDWGLEAAMKPVVPKDSSRDFANSVEFPGDEYIPDPDRPHLTDDVPGDVGMYEGVATGDSPSELFEGNIPD